MKILHITASYKPAYAYGGPIMSVAKLCEEVGKSQRILRNSKSQQSADRGGEGFDSAQPDNDSAQPDNDSDQRDNDSDQPGIDCSQQQPNVTVYTTLANGKEELPYRNGEVKIVDGVKVHYFKRITKDHSHLSLALLWHLWTTVKTFDIVHIHAWWNLVTIPACLVAVLRGKKVILTPRGTLSNYSFENNNSKLKSLFHQHIGKSLLNKTYFHCTSQKEVDDTKALLSPKAIFDIPNFVELPWDKSFDSEKLHKSDELNLIFLSRIEKKKGLEMLFEVLATLDFPYQLDIVGNGETGYVEELKQLSGRLKISENIHWLGAIYGEQKFDFLAKYDYFILPSYDENFANVVIESVFSGTPVLITEDVGLSDYVIKKELGLVCERNHKAIKAMLTKAIEAKKDRKFNSETINKMIRSDFAEPALRNRYLNMYQEVLNS